MNAYPLTWPDTWPRTPAARRKEARFGRARSQGQTRLSLTVAEGADRVLVELERMGLIPDRAIISTNVQPTLSGRPRSGMPEPADPGAAVYWTDPQDGPMVMAIDIYDRVADNLAAIAATLDAMRAIERHGGATILRRAFTGFAALPAPGRARTWREVLGMQGVVVPTLEAVKAAYRAAATVAHPDKGGSDSAMAEVNAAYAEAQQACGFTTNNPRD